MDEQLRGSGNTNGEYLHQMYRSICKVVLAAARKHIGLKAAGMTGEYWKTQEIMKAERERDEHRERLGFHSEEYKAKDHEVKNLIGGRKAEIWVQKVTTEKARKEMWSILHSHTTN